jgi:hypothetical protein
MDPEPRAVVVAPWVAMVLVAISVPEEVEPRKLEVSVWFTGASACSRREDDKQWVQLTSEVQQVAWLLLMFV